jgi:hypothetical protein
VEDWIPVVGSLGLALIIVIPFIANKVMKYKLEIARINAETTLKAEQIRANNQLEIEMLVKQQEGRAKKSGYQEDADYDQAPDKIRRRV